MLPSDAPTAPQSPSSPRGCFPAPSLPLWARPGVADLSPLPAFDDEMGWNVATPGGFASPTLLFPVTDEINSMMSWWPMPELDDRSPDVSPHCSEDEGCDKASLADKPSRKESSRKRKASTRQVLASESASMDDGTVDQSILEEDTDSYKTAVFPVIEERARQAAAIMGDKVDAVTCLVEAFTNGQKHGRPLPSACEELLKRATEEVSESKKRQRVKGAFKATANKQESETGAAHFPCSSCSKEYSTAEGLRLHVRNHHEVDKRWVCHAASCCANAERAFVRQADLRMHIIRVHSPVRPFPCRVPGCNKAFSANNELRRHIGNFHQSLADRLYAEGRALLPM